MEGQPPADVLPSLDVVTTTIDPDEMPRGHSGQRSTEPMSDEETQERTTLALDVAATSGFMESVTSTAESCLTLCNICRDKFPVRRLSVCHGVPPSIMEMVYPGAGQAEAEHISRVVPHQRVLEIVWRFYDSRSCQRYRDDGEIYISKIKWPIETTDISFPFFNRRIDAMIWPPELTRLGFGIQRIDTNQPFTQWDTFNMPLHAATLPDSLREIYLGNHFNQPIEGVAWPRGLERLSLPGFDHSIRDVQWPSGLKSLEFVSPSEIGLRGCEDIAKRLPFPDTYSEKEDEYKQMDRAHLQSVSFNQPLGTTLPTSLETLCLPENFQQPLHNVAWPEGVTLLGLTFYIHTPFTGTIPWPGNLRHLCMADRPAPWESFSFPPNCEVTILRELFEESTNYNTTEHYDRDENPDDFFEESDQYDGCYNQRRRLLRLT